MAAIDYFFCVNVRGVPVVLRGFLKDPAQTIVESFFNRVSQDLATPSVFREDSLNYCFVTSFSLYFVVVTEESAAPALLLELLSRLILVISDYLGICNEAKMLQNLGLVYEIVDEVLAFGCPQATDASNLMHLVHNTVPDNDVLRKLDVLDILELKSYERPLALSSDDRRNTVSEIYLIINEVLEVTLNTNNDVLRSTVTGIGTAKSFLDGQPTVLLQFDPQMYVTNRPMQKLDLQYDDISFATFVQSSSFESDRTIQFVPPQGSTRLFTYRTNRPVYPPFRITTVFENVQAKVVVARVSIAATYPAETFAEYARLRFQCPIEISSGSCELPPSVAATQEGEYDAVNRQVVWSIKRFTGLTEFSARFRFMFDQGIQGSAERLLGPIALDFNVREVTPSGLSIRNFEVATPTGGVPPKRWMKRIASTGCYTFNFI
jgi:hypothetical protein